MALYKRSSTEVAEGECIPTHGTKLENGDGQRHKKWAQRNLLGFPENLPVLL